MKESYIKLPNITVSKLQDVVDYLDENNIEYIEDYKEEVELNKYKEVLDKIKEIVDKAPCLWCVDEEFERVDGTIELSYKEYTGWKDILELLEEIK